MKKGKSSERNLNSKILSRTKFMLDTPGVCLIQSKNLKASVKLCPDYEIPLPVNLGRKIEAKIPETEMILNKAVEKVAELEKINLNPVLKLKPLKVPVKIYENPVKMEENEEKDEPDGEKGEDDEKEKKKEETPPMIPIHKMVSWEKK